MIADFLPEKNITRLRTFYLLIFEKTTTELRILNIFL